MKKRGFAAVLAAVLLLAAFPGRSAAAENDTSAGEENSAFTGKEKVVVSVEGLTLGQGFYVEPTVYTFDELLAAAKARGEEKTAEEITAQDAILYAIEDGGYTPNIAESAYGGKYLAGIYGADKGYVKLPDILKDKVTWTENSDTELGEYDYTTTGGWLFTEHNTSANVGMGEYRLSEFGKSCTVEGEAYYVIRFMFSLYHFGADLGVEGWDSTPTDENPWGTAVEPLFPSADRSAAYVKYAVLKEEGFFAEHDGARAAALQKMEILDAEEQQLSDVYQLLVQAEEAAQQAGSSAAASSGKTEAETTAAAAQTEAEANAVPSTTQKAENAKTGDRQAPLFWTVFLTGGAAAGMLAARKKRACENGKTS